MIVNSNVTQVLVGIPVTSQYVLLPPVRMEDCVEMISVIVMVQDTQGGRVAPR